MGLKHRLTISTREWHLGIRSGIFPWIYTGKSINKFKATSFGVLREKATCQQVLVNSVFFLAPRSCERICERLSRKREPLYLDLGIEIEAADSSQHRRLAVDHAQQLPVLSHYMGAGPT